MRTILATICYFADKTAVISYFQVLPCLPLTLGQ